MKCCVHLCLFLLAFLTLTDPIQARRGNPASNSAPSTQMFLVDSDDDHPMTPQYRFVDTLFNPGQWNRVTGFANNDDASVAITNLANWNFQALVTYPMFDGTISTNGTIALRFPQNAVISWHKTNNQPMPIVNLIDTFTILAPLWADWELRTTGDSTKIFYRVTADSFYVTYYNLALKGTEGQIRATFQVTVSKDTTISYHYRSFDGVYAGLTAEQIIQRTATIAYQAKGYLGINYLNKGHYYAISAGSSMYAKDLHDGLAIRMFRMKNHLVNARTITFPTAERQELPVNNFTFAGAGANWQPGDYMVYYDFAVKNLSTNTTITTKADSMMTYEGFSSFYEGPTYQGLPCGEYQVTMTVRMPRFGTDTWVLDNVLRKNFYVLSNSLSFPFYEQFNEGLSGCTWANIGAEVKPAADVMFDPVAPRNGQDGALVLDRTDLTGFRYTEPFAGDTLTSAPINMAGKSDVYLNFSYQRGLKTDDREAGSQTKLKIGPDMQVMNSGGAGVSEHADTLVIEGLLSTGARWNPAASSWIVLHTITGGLDRKTNKVRIKLPSSVISDHFRMRFRLKSRENGTLIGYPHEDNDSWVIDGIQLISPKSGETEFEISQVDLGVSYYTTVPRDVRFIRPKVTVSNNGRNAGLGAYLLRMIIHDQLNREVYHKSQSFVFPNSFTDTVITLQDWEIRGSQGGVFKVRTYFEQNYGEIYRANDTNFTTRAIQINDVYALDDGEADTVGSLVASPLEWYYKFVPLTSDSLRGMDLYFLGAQAATSWQLEFKRGGNVIGNRQFNSTPNVRGWLRSSFAPLYLPADTIQIHITQTVGSPIGGDGSRGLIWTKSLDPTFTVFYPEIINQFALKDENLYYGGTATQQNGGVLLPMARFVYSGAQQYLPVELVRFTAKRVGEGVDLAWRTAREENTRSFSVERLLNDEWQFVAEVGAKNSRLGSEYFSQDAFAPFSQTTYRLTEQDLDGTSRIIGHVNIGAIGEAEVLDLRVFPNPASSILSLRLSGAIPERIVVRDVVGREVLTGTGVSELDVTALSAGTYFVQVEANGQHLTRSFVIQR